MSKKQTNLHDIDTISDNAESRQSVERDRTKAKKRIRVGIVVLTVLGIISVVILQNPQWLEWDNTAAQSPTSMYSDRIVSYNFYPTDYDLDVTADEVYMELNRYVYYKNGNETFAITDDDYDEYGAAVAFFGEYFKTVIAGDADTYNTYFTDKYYETNKPYTAFAPQMLYDILIELLSEQQQDNGDIVYAFDVVYKIHRNDGSFRNDIDSDSSKKLYFELLESNGEIKIDRITYYVRG